MVLSARFNYNLNEIIFSVHTLRAELTRAARVFLPCKPGKTTAHEENS